MRVTHLPRCGALLLAAALLTGCGPDRESEALPPPGSAPVGTSSAAASASPGTAADDEATGKYAEVPTDLQLSESEKAAAREALVMVDEYYAYYFDMMKSGGEDYDRMSEFASDEVLQEGLDSAEDLRSSKDRAEGSYIMRGQAVSQVDLDPADGTSIAFVKVDTCVDVTDAGLVDENGQSLVDDSRPDTVPHTFVVAEYDSGWRVSQKDTGTSEC